jgi:hypothetical protein
MRTSTAYFAGVGTVAMAIAAGLGGGYLAANVISPHEQKFGNETRLERRMASQAIPMTAAPSEPVRYASATPNPVAAPPQAEPPTPAAQATVTQPPAPQAPAKIEPQTAASNSVSPVDDKTASHTAAAPPPAKPAELASEKAGASQEAFAKTRDADLKRTAREQRRAERRQHWADSRQYWADKRRLRQPRERELDAVEQKVREETEPRQVFAVEPVKMESPRIRLFDQD